VYYKTHIHGEAVAPLAAEYPYGISIFKAIQEQLGLKLEPGRASVEILIVDHAERPSGN